MEQWAEIRRMRFVGGLAIKEIVRQTGRDRGTVRKAIRSDEPPRYQRRGTAASKLDPHRDEVARLLADVEGITNTRIRELITEAGYGGGKTILDECLRELRPIICPARTYQRTVYRPAELLQLDLWEPKAEVHGPRSRAGRLVSSRIPDLDSPMREHRHARSPHR